MTGTPIRVVGGLPSGSLPPVRYGVTTRFDVQTPMRDGVSLAMDVIGPNAPGKFPVILVRTPYDKVAACGEESRTRPALEDRVRRGFIVATQDCRGRFNSDGVFDPYRQEHADGFDTVEWLARQPWCDGNVGMIGGSYAGQTQWFAASQAPKALKAIVPIVSPPGHPFLNEPIYGGAFLMCMAEWMCAMGRRSALMPALKGIFTREPRYFEAMPLARLAEAAGVESRWWNEMLSHATFDAFWRSCGYEEAWSRMTVPALNVTGWWDMNFIGAPRNFAGMRQHGATAEARQGQRLVIGPWPHWVNTSRSLSGVDFGPSAVVDLNGYVLRFFDHWLRGNSASGLDGEARVHVFVIGANEWWETDEWPPPGTKETAYYLHGAGSANSHRGDGTLSPDPPGDEPYDRFVSDPLDPVRQLWNLHEGPVDDRPVTARPDVLCYTSAALAAPLDIVGPVRAVLYGASSARDCDWHVRLVDVQPDGAARFLCHGVLRARFRLGFDKAEFLESGEVERFEVDMTATGIRFLPGHRIRVEVASSWFSRFDRNPQTDAVNWLTDTRAAVVARQEVHHDRLRPSQVVLPVVKGPVTC